MTEYDEPEMISIPRLKEDLIEALVGMSGRALPVEARRFLALLSHPEVIGCTNAYFSQLDVTSMCMNYEAPWNCVREAEAKFQTLRYGWHGGLGLDGGWRDDWCENCKRRGKEMLYDDDSPFDCSE